MEDIKLLDLILLCMRKYKFRMTQSATCIYTNDSTKGGVTRAFAQHSNIFARGKGEARTKPEVKSSLQNKMLLIVQ